MAVFQPLQAMAEASSLLFGEIALTYWRDFTKSSIKAI
jgi:hypothetical protein